MTKLQIDGKGRVPPYKKIKKLGAGGFGSAYLVECTKDLDKKCKYVMKEIKCRDKEEVLQALREMVTLRILQCPYVVYYKDYFQEGLSVYLVMEYCEGGDLYTEMNAAVQKKQYIPEDKVMKWFVQIAMGLNQIHERQFMHRDIKPSNVFLDADGNAKLGDFGLSNVGGKSKDDVVDATMCGTPGFISPEIERGEPYNAKSDVWALGCSLYEMVCLRSAYTDTMEERFPQTIPSFYSKDMQHLVSWLLIEQKDDRPHLSQVLESSYVRRHVRRSMQPIQASSISTKMTNVSKPLKKAPSLLDIAKVVLYTKTGDVTNLFDQFRRHPFAMTALLGCMWLSLKMVGIL
jgi:NIMA (never in mitosis gene a)-related kinase